jgi:hypothetical protein
MDVIWVCGDGEDRGEGAYVLEAENAAGLNGRLMDSGNAEVRGIVSVRVGKEVLWMRLLSGEV